MALDGSHAERASRLIASTRVVRVNPPRVDAAWPFRHPEPPDLAALYAVCDGLELDDGVRLFGRGELFDVTSWLVLEKGLSWPDDMFVAGERRDIIVVVDLDAGGSRARGGVLEVGADDLGSFERVASEVVGYLLSRAGAGDDVAPSAEIAAKNAAAAGDRDALQEALARPTYPGSDRIVGPLFLELGALCAGSGDEGGALRAFERSVEARLSMVGRGGRDGERRAAWRAAAHVARLRGAEAVAAACEERAVAAR